MASVDDLVASLNANHIGQEALELAALQAQLQQALLAQQMQFAHNAARGGPLNSPVMRTPSASISLDPTEAAWVRHNYGGVSGMGTSSSSKMRCSIDELPESDEMDEDERMVEDLLLSSPTSGSGSFSRAPQAAPAHRARKTSLSVHMIPLEHGHGNGHGHHELPSPNTSLFTTTDPFYLASLQNAHAHGSGSVFAQAGRPAAHSPFVKHHHVQYSSFGHGFQGVAPDHQPAFNHNMFAAAAAFGS